MNFVKVFFVTLLSILLLVSFFFVYFDSDRLAVKKVRLLSNIGFFSDGIDNEVIRLIKGNILLIDRLEIVERIKSLSDDVKDVDVMIYPPDTVSVDIIYRKPVIRVIYGGSVNKFFDGEFVEVREYSPGMFSNLVTVFVERWEEESLRELAKVISGMDSTVVDSKFFPKFFVIKKDGIYAMNKSFNITVFFGGSVDEDKMKKSFLVIKYIIQKNLPVRFVDARFDNMIGK